MAQKKQPLAYPGTEGKRLVSNSSRSGFTFCPRSFELEVLQGLKRRITERHFSFGSEMHECMEAFYEGASLSDLLAHIGEWRDEALATIADLEDPRRVHVQVDANLVSDMLTRYVDAFCSDLDRYEVLAVEQPFIVPIGQRLADGTLRTDALYAYTGVFDLVLRDRRSLQVWVVDHKSTQHEALAKFEAEVKSAGSGQAIGYVYAARFFWPECCGIVYNVLRKKIPSKVVTTQCKACKGTGQVETKCYTLDAKGKRVKDEAGQPIMLPSTFTPCEACHETGYGGISKTVPDTTLELFDAEINDLLACNPAMSREYIDETRQQLAQRVRENSRFLYRYVASVNTRDIEEWLSDVYQVAHAMGHALKAGRWYRNLAACSVNGRKCKFLSLCLSGDVDAAEWERKPRDPFIPHETVNNEEEEV